MIVRRVLHIALLTICFWIRVLSSLDENSTAYGQTLETTNAASEANLTNAASEANSTNAAIPYRRIFVPQGDLSSIGLERYSAIDAIELNRRMEQYANSNQNAAATGFPIDGSSSPVLASHYLARLVGSDLVSKRSRLVLPRSLQTGDRVTLQPWSLALGSKVFPNEAVLRPTEQSTEWTFDEQGLPRVPISSTEYENSITSESLRDREIVQWFGWTVQSSATSLPNKLQFAFDVPKSADSLLVLALPPRAVVLDSATVARRIDDWSEMNVRLGAWAEAAKDSLTNQNSASLSDSLWLIELSGSQRASFSVSLGAGERGLDFVNDNEAFRYSQLIKTQRLEHFIDGQEIRTICDAELLVGWDQLSPMRLSIAPGARLRRLTVNQQEVDWQLLNGWIQWNPRSNLDKAPLINVPVATEQTGPMSASHSQSMRVIAEFVTPLRPNSQNEIVTPRIAFDRGYVMSGSTVAHAIAPWRLTAAECESCRVVESATSPKGGNGNPLEYSWHDTPPVFSVGLERERQTRHCEVLTRLSNNERSILAVVRAKLFFLEQDANHAAFSIAPGWNVRSITSLDRNDPATVSPSPNEPDSPIIIRMTWDRIQRSRVAEIELQLYREADASSSKEPVRRLTSNPILQMQDWDVSQTLAIEDSSKFRLSLRENLIDLMVNEDSIPEWQRALLPRLSTSFLFLTEPTHSVRPNTVKPDRISNPELLWIGKPNQHVAKIETTVSRSSLQTLSIQHEIQIDFGSNRNDEIEIVLPIERVRWTLFKGGTWVSLDPKSETTDPTRPEKRVWRFDLSGAEKRCKLRGSFLCELSNEEEIAIPFPRVVDAEIQSEIAKWSEKSILMRCKEEHGSWAFDESGYKVLKVDTNSTEPKLIVQSMKPLVMRPWIGWESELDLLVDTLGAQKASLFLRSRNAIPKVPIVIELADNWHPIDVRVRNGKEYQTRPFQLDGRRLIVSNIPSEGIAELRLDLAGPTLARNWNRRFFESSAAFQWPIFSSDDTFLGVRRRLWLPKELSLTNDRDRTDGNEPSSRWPIWQQCHSLFETAFATDSRDRDPIAHNQGDHAIDALIPSWSDGNWRVELDEFDEYPLVLASPKGSNLRDTIRIHNVASGQLQSVIFFALLAVITPRLILTRRGFATVLCAVFIFAAHTDVFRLARFAFPGLIGMCVGYCVFVIHRLTSKRVENDSSLSHRNSTRWAPWNDREEHSDSISAQSKVQGNGTKWVGSIKATAISLAGFLLFLILGLLVCDAMQISQRIQGQEPIASDNKNIFPIVIPMDESGALAGTNVYIPDELRNILSGKPTRIAEPELGTRPISAKHILKIGSRGRADQVIMSYTFLVGEDLSPVRFPFNPDQLQALRFSVDNSEINPGSKLRRTGTQWEWTPDKQGKRTVQVFAQPVLRTVTSDIAKDSSISPVQSSVQSSVQSPVQSPVQQLEIGLIPVGNASLEIEIDSQFSIDVLSRGQVINPEAGRFIAMLGAVDRLQCKVSPLTPPDRNFAGESNETPVMNTELFIQNDILQAKTIIEFPKGVSVTREVEIEADAQWLPIGTHWGDAHWVDVRPGSTLSRRRYVLEWSKGASYVNPASQFQRDRQIAVVWVPQSTNQSLNVLFAECRDRRTRLGTLRYSRAAGSNWSIEGINTWTPAISSKEQLDWPELKTNPLALPLRIPLNGGFGILKPKPIAERQQARVQSKWNIDRFGENLTTRIELFGGGSNSETLHLDLPSNFVVTDVTNRSGPFRFLQRTLNGKLRLQILTDRKSLEISDILIKAKRVDPASSNGSYSRSGRSEFSNDWLEVPWLNLPASINYDQSLDIFASEYVGLRLDPTGSEILLGKGANQSIKFMTINANELRSNITSTSHCQLVRRSKPLKGNFVLIANKDNGLKGTEFELKGSLRHSIESKPSVVLEVPSSFKDRWDSELRIVSMPCPVANRAWLQVFLPETLSEVESGSALSIRFVPTEVDSADEFELMSQVRAVDDDTIATYYTAKRTDNVPLEWRPVTSTTPEPLREQFGIDSEFEIFEKDGFGRKTNRNMADGITPPAHPAIAQSVYQVLAPTQHLNMETSKVLLESRYWIDREAATRSSVAEWEWQLDETVDVLSVCVDGHAVGYSVSDSRVKCSIVPMGVCSEIVITTLHQAADGLRDDKNLHAPHLLSHPIEAEIFVCNDPDIGLRVGGIALTAVDWNIGIETLSEAWLAMFHRSLESNVGVKVAAPDSDLDRWQKHWNQRAFEYLQQWADTPGSQNPISYGKAVEEWHQIRSIAKTKLTAWESSSLVFTDTIHSVPSVTSSTQKGFVNPLVAGIGCLLVLGGLVLVPSWFGAILFDRPWWCLLGLGFFIWLFSGSVLPALILGTIGLVVSADSYLIFSERLRRNGLRGQRSP